MCLLAKVIVGNKKKHTEVIYFLYIIMPFPLSLQTNHRTGTITSLQSKSSHEDSLVKKNIAQESRITVG